MTASTASSRSSAPRGAGNAAPVSRIRAFARLIGPLLHLGIGSSATLVAIILILLEMPIVVAPGLCTKIVLAYDGVCATMGSESP